MELDIYRLEYLVGTETYGPFTARVYVRDQNLDLVWERYVKYLRAIPEPRDDGCGEISYGHRCGIINVDHFDTWFPRVGVRALLDAGFRIAHYRCDEDLVQVGNTQVLFNVRNSTYVGEVTYDELLDRMYPEFAAAFEEKAAKEQRSWQTTPIQTAQ